MRKTAHGHKPAPIPSVGSLRVDTERLEQLWAMRAHERVAAAMAGRFTLGEMLRWASRFPSEPPLVDGDLFFIAALTADAAESTGDAQRFWDGDYTPLPETADAPSCDSPADRRDMSHEGSH